ncbi:MAG: LPS export ABC transporter ATP-binding protein [Deltaproteobacteria bacterium]|nr:LPS export ABC transporter ATP-binding protein [Deltaproteobacteria bacterium]MCB9478790.1 LPS export ABC transporter ATP-binding protein [Deltaproteobacteria bacterium]MCB9489048.1 LPS export ABC transporter ATP-binding protein [Deltaproteobacteria bacterium]
MGRQLATENLVKRFGSRTVVDGVSIHVQTGEVVGLLGPNGAGKTTCFYMIVGLYRPDGGRVVFDGEELTNLPMYKRARKGLSYLAQEASIFRKLSVEDNIRAILQTLGISRQEEDERLEKLLEDLSITHIRKNPGFALSGGERRRVEISRALATRPEFILLDEPFAGIDPIAVGEIQDIIAQLKERGIGVIITDHNVRETLGITDRAYILFQGQILEEGDPESIAASPRAREIYLGEKFRL